VKEKRLDNYSGSGKEPPSKRRLTRRKERWRGLSSRSFFDKLFQKPYLFTFGFLVIITLILLPRENLPPRQYSLNQIAPSDIKAPYDFNVEDEEATAEKMRKAEEEVLPVFDYDSRALPEVENKISLVFKMGRERLEEISEGKTSPTTPKGEGTAEVPPSLWDALRQSIPFPISEEMLELLAEKKFDERLQEYLLTTAKTIMSHDILSNLLLLAPYREKGITRRDVSSFKEVELKGLEQIIDLMQVRDRLEELLREEPTLSRRERTLLLSFIQPLITPNLVFNRVETDQREELARRDVEPVFYQVRKGEIIVREGDRINELALLKLNALTEGMKPGRSLLTIIGVTLFVFILLFSMWRYIEYYQRRHTKLKNLYIMVGVILIATLLIVKFSIYFANSLGDYFVRSPFNNASSYLYAIPFAAGAMLLVLLVDAQMAVTFSLIFGIFVGIMTKGNFFLTFYSIAGCLTAIYGVFQYRERSSIIKSGLIVSLVNIVSILTISSFRNQLQDLQQTSFDLFCGFAGGVIVAMVASALLPPLESFFQITTDVRLLELSNLDRPLLRELALRAPGTYHHSIVVGNLAVEAAKAIHANSLFVRVATLYHDVGKMNKPEYFIENQAGFQNRHDKLTPHMSALVIISHVKEAVEMAEEHHLPRSIIDIIPQHHGTRLISYFYEKAKQMEDPKIQEVDEEDFRYPGPKPQTKEAAIIMIADAVEAASRTLADPTPARLKGLVKRVINDIFIDGQLDECDLTLRDLQKISLSCIQFLPSIYHGRVHYPGYEFEAKQKRAGNGGAGKKQPYKTAHRPE